MPTSNYPEHWSLKYFPLLKATWCFLDESNIIV